jgi:hypothetical protein
MPSHAVDKSFNLSFVLAEDNFEAAPARTVPAHQAPCQAERGARHQRESRDVESGTWPEALVDATRRQRRAETGWTSSAHRGFR